MDLFLLPCVLRLPRDGEPVNLPVPPRQLSTSTCSCKKKPQSPWLDFLHVLSALLPLLIYQRVKCHLSTHKLHSPLKKVPLRCLVESDSSIPDEQPQNSREEQPLFLLCFQNCNQCSPYFISAFILSWPCSSWSTPYILAIQKNLLVGLLTPEFNWSNIAFFRGTMYWKDKMCT